MVKDKKNGQCHRADKLIEDHCEKLLAKKGIKQEEKEKIERILHDAGSMKPE
jgi:glycyl-tRNA synthetase (class II)